MELKETIFDKLLSGQLSCDIVYQDDWVFAFRDIHPQAPTHVLVIPKKRKARFEELKDANPNEVGEFFCKVSAVAAHLGLEKHGYRVVINNGNYGQQTVEYLHAHILGGRPMHWPPG